MRIYKSTIAALIVLANGAYAAHAGDPAVKAMPAATNTPFFLVNDNRLTYSYIFNAADPGVTSNTAKQGYSFTHFDAWAYGTNFLNATMWRADSNAPANGCKGAGQGCAGATEFYGILRSTFGFNELFNTRVFTYGPLRNVSFEIGADAKTVNNAVASDKRALFAGLQFAFDLPYKGFINLAPMYYQELNHNSVVQGPALPSGQIRYNPTWAFEVNYYMDLGFLPSYLPLSVSGRASIIGPKGPQTSPIPFNPITNVQTTTEINSEPIRLTLDTSRMIWGDKYSHFLDVWVAYRYWGNKYGISPDSLSCKGVGLNSCTESSLYSGVTVKF
ncbi:hypothetical protein [Bradyrhizobium sp. 1]|uniref:hypothetical protein n=1 Tax=Bradyrhizobium sp. 1 TaxID=241591 RepID=UPI001FF7EC2B|nr:hypothetical protein [Bradyrhizobium sp. 1]MCK1395711.1 hypothetical protein [Bradyrhizobium sp. 1]